MSHPESNPDPARPRVLLVDDNVEGRRALERILEIQGFDATAVADGAAAREALRQGPPFDVVLTDLILPDTDGREVAREARAACPGAFIALITGWSFEADLRDIASHGIDQVYFKPLDVSELVQILRRRGAPGP
jgi:CheY-like chemotaxis protein